MRYRDGYINQLAEDEFFMTRYRPVKTIYTQFLRLYTDGKLLVASGYAWDGPSGPCKAIANRLPLWLREKYLKKLITPSLAHDAKYQLIRMGLIIDDMVSHIVPVVDVREEADIELHEDCLVRKMNRIRARLVYRGVRLGGGPSADPKNQKIVYEAP